MAGAFKEAAQGHVGVTDALVDGLAALVHQRVAILLGHIVWMVGRRSECCGKEGLLHPPDVVNHELQEGLIPDGPLAVKVVHAAILGRLAVLIQAVIMLVTDAVGVGTEAH